MILYTLMAFVLGAAVSVTGGMFRDMVPAPVAEPIDRSPGWCMRQYKQRIYQERARETLDWATEVATNIGNQLRRMDGWISLPTGESLMPHRMEMEVDLRESSSISLPPPLPDLSEIRQLSRAA